MNTINIICVTKERIDDTYRKVEYPLPCFNEEEKDSQEIVAVYWPNSPKSRFNQLEEGVRVAITGHLDAREKFDTILVVEHFDVLR